MPLMKGVSVQQVLPAPIEGKVIDARYDVDAGIMYYLVSWVSADGHECSKWFAENEVKEVA